MFIKLTNYYGPVYIRIDQIKSIETTREGKTIIQFIHDSEVLSVKETPEEIIRKIEIE